MANWTYSNVVFLGKNSRKLYEDLKESMKISYDKGENNWLGNLFYINNEIYGTMERIKALIYKKEFYLRSFILDFRFIEKDTLLLELEEAWELNGDAFMLIAKAYNLQYYCYCEEFGLEVYINTDKEGRYFNTRYRLSYQGEEDKEIEEYFITMEELLKYINKEELLGRGLTLNEINQYLEEYEIYRYDNILETKYLETFNWINDSYKRY